MSSEARSHGSRGGKSVRSNRREVRNEGADGRGGKEEIVSDVVPQTLSLAFSRSDSPIDCFVDQTIMY